MSASLAKSAALARRLWAHKQLKWLLLLALFLGVLIGHQTLGVMDRDEARFSQASKQMYLSGDYITPYFQDEIRAKKPIGIYWLQSASAALFGPENIAAYRLPSLLSFILSLLLIYHFSLRLFPMAPPIIRLFSAAFTGSALVVIVEAHLAKTDSLLLLLCLWQQMALYSLYQTRAADRPIWPWGQFWLAMGLAILVKGPIAPALAGCTLFLLVIMDRQIGWLRHLHLVGGLVILCLICLPWAVAVQMATDGAFLGMATGEDLLPKLVSGQESHGAPAGTYLGLLALLFFPASLFLGWLGRLGKAGLKADSVRFLLAWIIGYWVMIEMIPTKLPHYVLPVLPAISLLLAAAMMAPAPQARWQRYGEAILAAIALLAGCALIAILGWGAITLGGISGGRAFLLVILAGLIFAALVYYFWKMQAAELSETRHRQLLAVLACGALLHLVAIAGVVASLDRLHMSRQLDRVITAMDGKPAVMAIAGYHEPSAVFTLGTDLLLVNAEEAALLLVEAEDVVVIIETEKLAAFEAATKALKIQPDRFQQIDGVNMSRGTDITLHLFKPQ